MVYASWQYITENAAILADVPNCSHIDLIVYCEEHCCSQLPSDCKDLRYSEKLAETTHQPACLYLPGEPMKHSYNALNSFAFAHSTLFETFALRHYDYCILRSIRNMMQALEKKIDSKKQIYTRNIKAKFVKILLLV